MTTRSIRLKEWPIGIRKMKPKPEYIAKCKDNLHTEEVTLTVNEDGLVYDPNGPTEYDKKVILLGDSVFENLWCPEDKRVNAIIEQEAKKDGLKIKCLNGAKTGANLLHCLNIMINKVIPLRPDIVVLSSNIMDKAPYRLNLGYWDKSNRVSNILYPQMKSDEDMQDQFGGYKDFFLERELFFQIINNICCTLNIKLILCTSYCSKNIGGQLSITAMNDGIKKIAQKYNVSLIDFANLSLEEECFYDGHHLSIIGAQAYGKIIYQIINRLII